MRLKPSNQRGRLLFVAIVATLAVCLASLDELGQLWQGPVFHSVWTENIVDGGAQLRTRAVVDGKWSTDPEGLALEAGNSGSVTWKVEKEPDQVVLLVLGTQRAEWSDNTLEVSVDQGPFNLVAANVDGAGRLFNLEAAGLGAREVAIRFAAQSNPARDAKPFLVLDLFQLIVLDQAATVPALPVFLLLVLIPLLALVAAEAAGAPARISLGVSGGVLALAVLLLFLDSPLLQLEWSLHGRFRANLPLVIFGAGLTAYAWIAARRGILEIERQWLLAFALAGVLAFGFVMRWGSLGPNANLWLVPDAETVLAIAKQMAHPYDTDMREPLWPCFVKVFCWIFGTSQLAPRLFSMAFSMLLLWATFRLARDVSKNDGLGLVTVLMLALNNFFIYSAPLGLRTELYTLLLVGFSYFAFVPDLPVNRRTVGLASAAALLTTTVVSSYMMLVVLLGFAVWRHRLPWRVPCVVITITALAMAPHLMHMNAKFGDPLWYTNQGPVFYRNYEFLIVNKTGCAGCPTREQFFENSIAGEPISLSGYIFGMHSFTTVLRRTLLGYWRLYLHYGDEYLSIMVGTAVRWVHLVYYVGLAMMLFRRERELLVVAFFSINVLAFLMPIGIDPRLVAHPAPIMAIALALPVWWVADTCLTYVLRRWMPTTTIDRQPETTTA